MGSNIIFSWVEIINSMLPEMRKPSEIYFFEPAWWICILDAGFRKKLWAWWKRSLKKPIFGTLNIKTKIRPNLTLQFWQKWKWEIRWGSWGPGIWRTMGQWRLTGSVLKTWRRDYQFNTPWARLWLSQMTLALLLTFPHNSLGLIQG